MAVKIFKNCPLPLQAHTKTKIFLYFFPVLGKTNHGGFFQDSFCILDKIQSHPFLLSVKKLFKKELGKALFTSSFLHPNPFQSFVFNTNHHFIQSSPSTVFSFVTICSNNGSYQRILFLRHFSRDPSAFTLFFQQRYPSVLFLYIHEVLLKP